MAALAKDRNTSSREDSLIAVPVKKSVTIHAGSLVVADGGYAKPGVKAQNLVALGMAEQSVKGGAADGDATVLVRRGTFLWANSSGGDAVAQADLYKDVYIADDQTVTKTDTGASKAGKAVALDPDGVWVETL